MFRVVYYPVASYSRVTRVMYVCSTLKSSSRFLVFTSGFSDFRYLQNSGVINNVTGRRCWTNVSKGHNASIFMI